MPRLAPTLPPSSPRPPSAQVPPSSFERGASRNTYGSDDYRVQGTGSSSLAPLGSLLHEAARSVSPTWHFEAGGVDTPRLARPPGSEPFQAELADVYDYEELAGEDYSSTEEDSRLADEDAGSMGSAQLDDEERAEIELFRLRALARRRARRAQVQQPEPAHLPPHQPTSHRPDLPPRLATGSSSENVSTISAARRLLGRRVGEFATATASAEAGPNSIPLPSIVVSDQSKAASPPAEMEVDELTGPRPSSSRASASNERPTVRLGPCLHLGKSKTSVVEPCALLRPGVVFCGRQAYSTELAARNKSTERKRRLSEPQAQRPVPSSSVDLVPLAVRGRRMASISSVLHEPELDRWGPSTSSDGFGREADSWSVRVAIHTIDWEKGTLAGVMHALNVCKINTGEKERMPRVTTTFEGEIINSITFGLWSGKWGATKQDDVHQWSSLRAFEGLGEAMVDIGRPREGYILMRWKETDFCNIPQDQSGLTINGFYYVAMHRATGSIEALYFDPHLSPYQRMTLSPPIAFGSVRLA